MNSCEQEGKQTAGDSSFKNYEQKSCKFDFISHGKGMKTLFSEVDNSQYLLTRETTVVARHGGTFLQSQHQGSRGKRIIVSSKPTRATQKDSFSESGGGVGCKVET